MARRPRFTLSPAMHSRAMTVGRAPYAPTRCCICREPGRDLWEGVCPTCLTNERRTA